jgi:uncharacterized protein YbjT (DUF2867 family)
MKLVVLGATGSIGVKLVGQALAHGHSVTAFVRNETALSGYRERIRIVRGDLLNADDLRAAIAERDAVLSCFGPREPIPRRDTGLLKDFATALTRAMSNGGPRRVVVLSVAFLFKDSILPPAYLAGRLMFPGHVRDAANMENIFRASGLEWTIVRPPQFTDKPRNPKYRVHEGHLPVFGFTISREDVADFMLRAAEDRIYVGKIVGVSN